MAEVARAFAFLALSLLALHMSLGFVSVIVAALRVLRITIVLALMLVFALVLAVF
jgi:hypothetical protein